MGACAESVVLCPHRPMASVHGGKLLAAQVPRRPYETSLSPIVSNLRARPAGVMTGASKKEPEPLAAIQRAENLAKRLERPVIDDSAASEQAGGFFRPRTAVLGALMAFLFLLCRETWRAQIQAALSPAPAFDPRGNKPRAVGSQHAGLRFIADLRAGTALSPLSLNTRADGVCTPGVCRRSHVVRRLRPKLSPGRVGGGSGGSGAHRRAYFAAAFVESRRDMSLKAARSLAGRPAAHRRQRCATGLLRC